MLGRRVLACLLVVLMLSALLPQQALGATVLKRGSRGSAVQQLQQQLIKLGFLKGSADGFFGPQTEAAVRSFQKAYGLKQDGIAGPSTLAKLAQVSSNASGGTKPSQPSQGGSSGVPITTALKLGSRGSQVVTLQKRLNELGYNCGTADGVFGAKTRQAVMAFQRDNGLTADGIAGPKTVAKLFPANEPPQSQNPNPPSSPSNGEGNNGGNSEGHQNTTPPITTTLKLGSRGSQVVTLQKRLNELGYNCGTADGVFGAKTRQAVMAFQRDNGLTADGIVGPKTIAKLFPANEPPKNQNPQPEPQPQPQPDPEPDPNPTPEPQPEPGFKQFHGTPGTLEGKVIFVDAGHGGTDPGAVRQHEGFGLAREKDMVFDMALRLKRILEEAGATVILTRPDDRYYSLFYRSALVNTHILQTEVAVLEEEKEAAVEDKEDKEREKEEKEQQKAENEQAVVDFENQLYEKENYLEQYELQRYILENQQAVARSLFEQKDAEYLAAYSTHEDKKEELEEEEEALEDLISQRDGLQQQYNTVIGEIDVLRMNIADLEEQIQNLENKLNELPPGDPQRNTIQQQIAEAQADLNEAQELLSQKETESSDIESSLNQINSQIAAKEAVINQKKAELDSLALILENLKSERDGAKAQLDAVTNQLKEVERSIDETVDAIAELKEAIEEAKEAIPMLQNEIDGLEVEIQSLEEEIETLDEKITVLKTRIAQFDVYLKNPETTSRIGIYAGPLENGKRYATPELVEVFDLTREKYQDDYLFISLHCNSTAAIEQTTSSGISVFYRDNGPYSYNGTYGINVEYYKGYNAAERERFALTLLQQINATTNFSKKYTVPYKADFSVLRESNVISVLVEVSFINNPNDRALLIQEQTREDVAAGIYKGIVEYYK